MSLTLTIARKYAKPGRYFRRSGGSSSGPGAPNGELSSKCGFERLYVKQHVYHVPVLHNVGLALAADGAVLFGFGHAARGNQVVVVDDLRADEAPLQVGVDGPGGALGHGAPADRPGAHLILPGGQEADEAEEGVRFADHFLQPRRPHAHALTKLRGVLRRKLSH